MAKAMAVATVAPVATSLPTLRCSLNCTAKKIIPTNFGTFTLYNYTEKLFGVTIQLIIISGGCWYHSIVPDSTGIRHNSPKNI